MTSYQPGELILIDFPFSGSAQTKPRPALILLDTGDLDLVVARVTTQVHGTMHDVALTDWRGSGLLAPSVVRLHKLATLEKSLVRQRLGHLQPRDRQEIALVLQQVFGRW